MHKPKKTNLMKKIACLFLINFFVAQYNGQGCNNPTLDNYHYGTNWGQTPPFGITPSPDYYMQHSDVSQDGNFVNSSSTINDLTLNRKFIKVHQQDLNQHWTREIKYGYMDLVTQGPAGAQVVSTVLSNGNRMLTGGPLI
jgi:hypothetical protein